MNTAFGSYGSLSSILKPAPPPTPLPPFHPRPRPSLSAATSSLSYLVSPHANDVVAASAVSAVSGTKIVAVEDGGGSGSGLNLKRRSSGVGGEGGGGLEAADAASSLSKNLSKNKKQKLQKLHMKETFAAALGGISSPIDLRTTQVVLRIGSEYTIVILGCTSKGLKYQRLFYFFADVPQEERASLQGPDFVDGASTTAAVSTSSSAAAGRRRQKLGRKFIFNSPTTVVAATAKYSGNHQWDLLQAPLLHVDGQELRNVPLRFLTAKEGGPGFLDSDSERIDTLNALTKWTKRKRATALSLSSSSL